MEFTSSLEIIESKLEKEQNQLFDLISESEKLAKLIEIAMEQIEQKQINITKLEKLKALSKA